jgi:hypothetical protein
MLELVIGPVGCWIAGSDKMARSRGSSVAQIITASPPAGLLEIGKGKTNIMSDLPGFDNYFNLTGKVALVTGGTHLPVHPSPDYSPYSTLYISRTN